MDMMVYESGHLSLAHLVSSNINAMSTMYVYIFVLLVSLHYCIIKFLPISDKYYLYK